MSLSGRPHRSKSRAETVLQHLPQPKRDLPTTFIHVDLKSPMCQFCQITRVLLRGRGLLVVLLLVTDIETSGLAPRVSPSSFIRVSNRNAGVLGRFRVCASRLFVGMACCGFTDSCSTEHVTNKTCLAMMHVGPWKETVRSAALAKAANQPLSLSNHMQPSRVLSCHKLLHQSIQPMSFIQYGYIVCAIVQSCPESTPGIYRASIFGLGSFSRLCKCILYVFLI